jgi:hypothetical protein
LSALVFTIISPSIAIASTISQGYTSKLPLPAGTVVGLDPAVGLGVQAASQDSLEGLLGVAVGGQDALISFSSDANQVQVATSGIADTLVSDMQGPIKKGDKVTASPINGVGMKAVTSGKILGTAQTDFDPKAAGVVKRQIKDKTGASHDVQIGNVQVLVDVSYYVAGTGEATILPKFLQDLSTLIAGKKVSTVRIVTALLILLIGLASATILLYSSAKSSIVSIGRNPLSQKAVYKGLIQVFIISAVILAVSIGSVYLIISR